MKNNQKKLPNNNYIFKCEVPMRLISDYEFSSYGEIPRSDAEVNGINFENAVIKHSGRSNIFVVFISHRWLSAHIDPMIAHPDITDNSKHKLLCIALKKLKDKLPKHLNIYIWIDFFSIDQFDNDLKSKGIYSLPSYIEMSDCCLTPIIDKHYTENDVERIRQIPIPQLLKGNQLGSAQKGFLSNNLHTIDIFSRAWIRLEQFICSNSPFHEDQYQWFSIVAPKIWRRDRPHFFMTPELANSDFFLITIPKISKSLLNDINPLKGDLFNTKDLRQIEEVMNLCGYDDTIESSYKGEMDTNNIPNGEGTMHYSDGEIYNGLWINGVRNGKGVTYYADGSIYDGEYKNDKRHGNGKFVFASGNEYKGEFYENVQCGLGNFLWQNGNSYTGFFVNGRCTGFGIRKIVSGLSGIGGWYPDFNLKSGDYIEAQWYNDKASGTFVLHKEDQSKLDYYPKSENNYFKGILNKTLSTIDKEYLWRHKKLKTLTYLVAPNLSTNGIKILSNSDDILDEHRGVVIKTNVNSLLKSMPDECIDIICTDPPYNIGLSSEWDSKEHTEYTNNVSYWCNHLSRVLKPDGIGFIFMNVINAGEWIRFLENYKHPNYVIVCEYLVHLKQNSSSKEELKELFKQDHMNDKLDKEKSIEYSIKSTVFRESSDILIMFRKCKKESYSNKDPFLKIVKNYRHEQEQFQDKKWKKDINLLFYDKPNENDKIFIEKSNKILHLAQKPENIIRLLCRAREGENKIVFDPFGGSGTTASSAMLEGKLCITVEAEPIYAKNIATRINKHPLIVFILQRQELQNKGSKFSYRELFNLSTEELRKICQTI